MRATVLQKSYPPPPWNEREILRYAGADANAPQETLALLHACRKQAEGALTYKVCYAQYPITHSESGIDLGFAHTDSEHLKKALSGCHAVLVLAATFGFGIDRQIAACAHRSPAAAMLLQAIGSERVESLCDAFCEEQAALFASRGCSLRPRFSPGYGDLPLSLQRDIFLALDCAKHIGVALGENLLMSPQKSVTALIGIKKDATKL